MASRPRGPVILLCCSGAERQLLSQLPLPVFERAYAEVVLVQKALTAVRSRLYHLTELIQHHFIGKHLWQMRTS